jgi:hypothetical protein
MVILGPGEWSHRGYLACLGRSGPADSGVDGAAGHSCSHLPGAQPRNGRDDARAGSGRCGRVPRRVLARRLVLQGGRPRSRFGLPVHDDYMVVQWEFGVTARGAEPAERHVRRTWPRGPQSGSRSRCDTSYQRKPGQAQVGLGILVAPWFVSGRPCGSGQGRPTAPGWAGARRSSGCHMHGASESDRHQLADRSYQAGPTAGGRVQPGSAQHDRATSTAGARGAAGSRRLVPTPRAVLVPVNADWLRAGYATAGCGGR